MFLLRSFIVTLETFTMSPYIHKEDRRRDLAGVFLGNDSLLDGIHAANRRAVIPATGFIPRAHALDPCYLHRVFAVGRPHYLTLGRAGGGEDALELNAGNDVWHPSIPILRLDGGIEGRESRGEDQ